MSSKIKYKSPDFIAEDKDVTIQVTQVLDGKESPAKEVVLKAIAVAPKAPKFHGILKGQPSETVVLPIDTEPNTTLKIVSCSFGAASVSGTGVSIAFPDTDKDVPVTLVIKAIRGKFESPTKTINGYCEIQAPKALQIVGPTEIYEGHTAKFSLLNPEAGVSYSGTSKAGSIAFSKNIFTFTPPSITQTKAFTLSFLGTKKSKVTSKQIAILVKNLTEKANKLEIASTIFSVKKGAKIEILFKSVEGVLEVTNLTDSIGTAAVEGNKLIITGIAAGTAKFSVTQTGDYTLPSDPLEFSISVTEDVKVVKFDANGGTGTMEDVSAPLGSYTIPGCSFTAPEGKQFKCWAESADGKTKQHSVGESITFGKTGEFILYAIWEDIPSSNPSEN